MKVFIASIYSFKRESFRLFIQQFSFISVHFGLFQNLLHQKTEIFTEKSFFADTLSKKCEFFWKSQLSRKKKKKNSATHSESVVRCRTSCRWIVLHGHLVENSLATGVSQPVSREERELRGSATATTTTVPASEQVGGTPVVGLHGSRSLLRLRQGGPRRARSRGLSRLSRVTHDASRPDSSRVSIARRPSPATVLFLL